MANILDADEEGLDFRGEGISITFGGPSSPGINIVRPVEEGDGVTLYKAGQGILINSVKIDGPDKFTGTIYGFEDPMVFKVGNLKVDDTIRFRECHIISCSRK